MSACVKFRLDRPSRLAGHTEQTDRQTDKQTNKHIAFYYIDKEKKLSYRTGAVLAQKFWGRGIAPVSPFITECIFSVLRQRKIRTSYRPIFEIYHQQCQQLCNGFNNSAVGQTLRPVETRPEEPRAGVGFLGGGSEPSPHQLRSLGEHCKLPQRGPGRAAENLDFVAFGTSEITSERSASF